MIVSISQPRYLPWLGYFRRIEASDLFIYLDTVQYTPRDWENRNKVKTDRGWTWLTVPVKAKYRALLPEVMIDNEQPWQRKHWKTIETYYRGAAHFGLYEPGLDAVYMQGAWDRLADLNISLTGLLCEWLSLSRTKFVKSSEIGVTGQGTDLLLKLCKAVGATTYLSGPQGRNYLDEKSFRREGVEVLYQDYDHPTYRQLYGAFAPNMAAIDLIFNCGPESFEILTADVKQRSF
jgi:WbqC-like protein